MDIVFCKTRADPEFYRSYTDFWRLVELSEFEVVWLDELEPGRDAVYVVTPRNGELPGILPRLQGERRCKFVWWCLERPDAQGSVTRRKALENGIDELWLSDRWLARKHYQHGWGPVRFVPLGSNEGLGSPGNGHYLYDWAHLSYANPRRRAIYDRLPGPLMPNCWPPERHRRLQKTRFMINVHQDDWPVIEPLRFSLAIAYGMPIISEAVHDPYPYEPRLDGCIFVGRDTLPWSLLMAFDSFAQAREFAHRGRERMTQEFEFGRCVEEAAGCLR